MRLQVVALRILVRCVLGLAVGLLLLVVGVVSVSLTSALHYSDRVTDEQHVLDGCDWNIHRIDTLFSVHIESHRRHTTPVVAVCDSPASALIPLWADLESPRGSFSSGASREEIRVVSGRGWPVTAFWHEFHVVYSPTVGRTITGVSGGWVVRPSPSTIGGRWPFPYVIPYRPVWSGLVINSALLGLLCWIAFAGLVAIIRRVRSATGTCRSCGYDLRGSGTHRCPECGSRGSSESSPTVSPQGLSLRVSARNADLLCI